MRLVPLCRYGPDAFAAPWNGGGGSAASIKEDRPPACSPDAQDPPPQPAVCTSAASSASDVAPTTEGAPNERVPPPRGNNFLYVILCVRLSHCGQFLACGCSDGFVRVYRAPVVPEVIEDEGAHAQAPAAPKPIATPLCRTLLCQKGNTSPVTSIAWRPPVPARPSKSGHSRRTHATDGYSHVFIATTGAGDIFQCALSCTHASTVSRAAAVSISVGASSPSYSVNIIWKETIPDDQLLCCCYSHASDMFAAAGSARVIYVFSEHSKKLHRKLDKPPALPCMKAAETGTTKGGHSAPAFASAKGAKAKWAPTTKNEDDAGDWLRLKQKPAAHYYTAAAAASRGAHANRITQLLFLKKFKMAPEEALSSVNLKTDRGAVGKAAANLPAANGSNDAFKNWNNKTLLLSAGADESVKLWDVDEGGCISSLADVAPLGDGVDVLSSTSVVVASCRNQQQVQLFTLPSFATTTTVDFNCTCTCPATLQPNFASPAAAATKNAHSAGLATTATTGNSSSGTTRNDVGAMAATRCCGNGCKHFQDSSTGKATTAATDSKCDEADLYCYIHACKALPVEGAELLICSGSNRNQLRCYARSAPTTTPALLPAGGASFAPGPGAAAVAAASSSPSPSPPSAPLRPAMKGNNSALSFALFGLASFGAPPNTLDCVSMSSLSSRDRNAAGASPGGRLHRSLIGGDAFGGNAPSGEAGPGSVKAHGRRGEGKGTDVSGGEASIKGGLAPLPSDAELSRQNSSDCGSEFGFGLTGKLKKISFTAVFARPQGGGAADKKKAALAKDAKQPQKEDQEPHGGAQATKQKSGCLALVVTACYDQVRENAEKERHISEGSKSQK